MQLHIKISIYILSPREISNKDRFPFNPATILQRYICKLIFFLDNFIFTYDRRIHNLLGRGNKLNLDMYMYCKRKRTIRTENVATDNVAHDTKSTGMTTVNPYNTNKLHLASC
jgi:hypothetical protein